MSAAQVVREYGQAFRGDWGDIDGRSVQSDMETIADWLTEPDTFPGDKAARDHLGVCPLAGGHWTAWCDDDCNGETDD